MPTLIPRQDALVRIRSEVGDAPCLMCAVRDDVAGPRSVLAEDEELLVVLPRYVRRWGQLLVILKPHVTSYHEVAPALWQRASHWAWRAANVIERCREPLRCYVAATGSAAGEITQSSVHLHLHVIPLYRSEDRPTDIFSWSEGIYVAEEPEWHTLLDDYRQAWEALDAPL